MKEVNRVVQGLENPIALTEAISYLSKAPKVKFDETVELHFNLNVDLKASDQGVRGTVVLPHGIGKSVKVAVLIFPVESTKVYAPEINVLLTKYS